MHFRRKDLLQIILSLVLLPIIMWTINEIKFLEIKDDLEVVSEQKIIVVYDDFESNHGNVVCKILTNELNSNDYKLLRFDYNKVNLEVIEKVLIYLIEEEKTIYLNNSNYPDSEISSGLKVLFFKRLSQYENINIFQAGGNNENIVRFIKNFTGEERAEEINQTIYKKLDSKLLEIKKLAENENVEQLISMFGRTYGVSFANIYRFFTGTREEKMKDIIDRIVKKSINDDDLYGVNNKTKKEKIMKDIVQLHVNNMKQFLFIAELQHQNTNVLIVSSKTKLLKDMEKPGSFLDCPIQNLLRIELRKKAYVGEGKNQIIGTSISAPLALASFLNKDQ